MQKIRHALAPAITSVSAFAIFGIVLVIFGIVLANPRDRSRHFICV